MKKIAVVTGAAKGIGKETAFRLANEGMHILMTDIDETALKSNMNECAHRGLSMEYCLMDVQDPEQVEKTFENLAERFGRLDVLVNNAGITKDAMLVGMSDDQFDQVISVNLKGTFNCARAAAKLMKKQQSGSIINISSICGIFGNIGQTNYTASKWGVIGMTKTWAKELGRSGIRVNAVAPGFIETDIIRTIPEEVVAQMKSKVALKRSGQPSEVAAAIAFLASDDASFITGSVLEVTGGMTI